MTAHRILVVDSPARELWALAARLQAEKLAVVEVTSAAAARDVVAGGAGAVVVHHHADEAAALVELARSRLPDADVIVVLDDSRSAVEWAAAVAPDAIVWTSALADGAARIIRRLRRRAASVTVPASVGGARLQPDDLVGDSDAIARVRTLAARLADVDVPAVIVGEPGTGRATTARIVHDSGGRADRPFVRVDCGRATTTDLTAELFGAGRQPGIVEAADGGTLLLERVDRLPLTAQLLLLRLIEDGTFRPRGAFADRTANVRALTTTTRRLESDVEAGRFRRDLYCRLSVVTIDVPPLRARGDDVVKLARHFARRGAELTGIELDDEVEALLRRYHWPGNVRELDLVVARARLLAPDALRLGPAAFPGLATPRAVDQGLLVLPDDGIDLARLERQLVEQALERTGGNQTHAAQLLGLRRDQIRYRMLKYGLQQ